MNSTKKPAVYILSNKHNGVLYTGVTSNLIKRIFEHKHNIKSKFSSKYNCKILVYYEQFETINEAILREKQLKSGSRAKKITLIESMNPNWTDLYNFLVQNTNL